MTDLRPFPAPSTDAPSTPPPVDDDRRAPSPSVPALRLLAADDALVCVDDACLPEEPRA